MHKLTGKHGKHLTTEGPSNIFFKKTCFKTERNLCTLPAICCCLLCANSSAESLTRTRYVFIKILQTHLYKSLQTHFLFRKSLNIIRKSRNLEERAPLGISAGRPCAQILSLARRRLRSPPKNIKFETK